MNYSLASLTICGLCYSIILREIGACRVADPNPNLGGLVKSEKVGSGSVCVENEACLNSKIQIVPKIELVSQYILAKLIRCFLTFLT